MRIKTEPRSIKSVLQLMAATLPGPMDEPVDLEPCLLQTNTFFGQMRWQFLRGEGGAGGGCHQQKCLRDVRRLSLGTLDSQREGEQLTEDWM